MKKILILILSVIFIGLNAYSQNEYKNKVYIAFIPMNPLYSGEVRIAAPGGITLDMTRNANAFVTANITSGDKFLLYLEMNHPCNSGCKGNNHYLIITNSVNYERKVSTWNKGVFQDMIPFDPSGGLTNLTIYFY